MKDKFAMLLLALVAGVIIGAAIVWISFNCCCQKKCCHNEGNFVPDTSGIHRIDTTTANLYFKTYLTNFISVDTFKAFTINYDQYIAMKIIAEHDSKVHGFRIYMGMDKKTPVRMVVGTGSPDRVKTIYATSDESSGPCPQVCDDTSPIMDR